MFIAQPLRRDLRRVYQEGVSWSVMVGIGETYFPAFVLAVGLGEIQAGLIATVPLLLGGLLQLATPHGVNRLGSRRRWVALCAFLQAASFLPLILAAILGRLSTVPLFLVASLYWATGMGAGPAWSAWMSQIIPRSIRTQYFSLRSRATNLGVLAGLLLGGGLLQLFVSRDRVLLGFALIFTLAAVARLISGWMVLGQSEGEHPRGGERIVGPRRLLATLRHRGEGRLLLYLVVMMTMVSIASPYFTPYMLRDLGFSYTAYTSLIGASFLAKVFALSYAGTWVKRLGAVRMLRIGAIGIVLVPLPWLFTESYPMLMGVQILSGVVWSVHEFAAMLLFFEMSEGERVSLLTTYNLANAVALVGGSVAGGYLFHLLGGDGTAYHTLFAVSSATRFLALFLLAKLTLGHEPELRLVFRNIALRPSAGSILRPVIPGLNRPAGGDLPRR